MTRYEENQDKFQTSDLILNGSSVLKNVNPASGGFLAQNRPFPAPPPPPAPIPGQLPPPEQLLTPSDPASPPQQEIPSNANPGRIFVERFEVEGNTVFSKEKLAEVLKPFTGKELTFAEILQARSAITQLYVDNGYITSGALIPIQALNGKVVKIQVVEGGLEGINVSGLGRLNPSYVRSRIGLATRKPLNVPRLLDALRVLQLDPLIRKLSAELSAGSRLGLNVLDLQVQEADTFSGQITLDNGRSPSVGTFRRRAQITQANLLGLGDGFVFGYTNTDGSNGVDLSYTLPINARNGSLNFAFGTTSSNVIERPFSRLDIISDSRYYELTFRQPIVQTPSTEFSLGLTASRRESETSLLDRPFPLAQGADDQGRTRVSSLRFFQEWTNRSSTQVIAARSQFNLGIGAFDATINGNGPDSRFLSWRGQAQWVRRLAPDTLFLIRGDVQLADRALVPTEQFGLGGLGSVRGYRQDFLLTDNGALLSAEVRFPIYKTSQTLLSLVPFVDFGTVWNSGGRENPSTSTLASAGLGLQFVINDYLTARLDWGIPLVSVDTQKRTWQESGIYFSITASPF
ncbi:MAG: ShlB/FhaC/HecB family hemolysin secretion/activation protein [Calothrix sp. SM1_7_51]|nr:ShlB/FhaC/HecB family hemolysin secretion/activation protein [Calothrix sp. SM1_7_51]